MDLLHMYIQYLFLSDNYYFVIATNEEEGVEEEKDLARIYSF